MKPISKSVFRAYDLRGVVDKDMDGDWVETLGRACGAYFLRHGQTSAVVGHDCRLSSPEYQQRLAAGLAAAGLDVICLGMVPTPVFYFACKHLGKKAGVMITASHNPPEYNGFKVWCGESTIHTAEIDALFALMAAGEFPAGRGVISQHNIVPMYLDHLAAQVPEPLDVKVVVDGGNGAGGLICKELLERIGCTVVPLYCEPDGRFPNHHPDPVIEKYIGDLKAAVVETGADFGAGLDGDADRLGVVDETGALMYGDQLLAIYARDMLRDFPGAMVIGEVKCSHLLYKDIAAHGGEPLMWITGHSMIKAKMAETGARLAGEMSGHMFFADRYFGFDDGIYSALRIAQIVAANKRQGLPLSRVLADWPRTANTPELRVDCADDRKFAVVEQAKTYFKAQGYDVNDVDGVRLTFPDGWALMRASNTQPSLVLRFEAESPARLAEYRALVEGKLADWIGELKDSVH
ncbi:phosphomannomutase/phosphoglucomutase [Megalodesulfovibrio gigas]|uniref:Putative phosphomannomutase n=1 Tax=Megalodesulfovibrio gigas (strain ATCC 19364 / DSM 1382 / NCIMB 9332 / VKM B-1759) TaxID=1121448 RepID=T2GFX3_MEGG1|nr:phosphomannomutase/phosphoglucomutase [Megalodesulfovibrio gigas]AGW15099.1 putative phosphomannomutase [Megalodesulfovibrio gigas DSM 1382 = ATCC 19364]